MISSWILAGNGLVIAHSGDARDGHLERMVSHPHYISANAALSPDFCMRIGLRNSSSACR